MADFSISLHEDDSFNLDHDNRVYCSPNINKEKSGENISYEGNCSLEEFYQKNSRNHMRNILKKSAKVRTADE